MTTGEFRSWLEGYLEDNKTKPEKQIERIKEKAAELVDTQSFTLPNYPWTYPVDTPQPYRDTIITPGTADIPNITWTTWVASGPNGVGTDIASNV